MDIDGWIRSALEPLEPLEPIEPREDRPGGITEVGSESVARALIALRGQYRDEDEDDEDDRADAIPTAPPPPPRSDIRMIGGTRNASDEDPLALYAEALGAPTLPPPRMRRETMKLPAPMRPRQATLVMIDRPIPSPMSPATPAVSIVPAARPRIAAEPPPPAPFRGNLPILVLAFALGSALAVVVAVMASRWPSW